jgi:dipeptidyl aminopeptidase/acylaminoacyl peptidase
MMTKWYRNFPKPMITRSFFVVTVCVFVLAGCGIQNPTPESFVINISPTLVTIAPTEHITPTQPPAYVPPESTSTMPASPVELHGILIYNDHENYYRLDLMSKESSWIIDRTEEWAAFWFAGGPSKNGTVYITYNGKTSNNTGEIYELNPETKQLKRITWDQQDDHYLSMSPDGHLLAFVSCCEDSDMATRLKLNVLDVEKNKINPVAERGVEIGEPHWSPDGRKIAFIDLLDEAKPIEIIDYSGRETTQYPINAIDISWSPDGARLAVARAETEDNGIDILNTTTGEIEQRIDTPSVPAEISWSPVDEKIVVQLKTKVNKNRYSENTSLHMLDLKKSEMVKIQDGSLDGSTEEYHPLWSKDGKYIAYFTEPKNVVFWSVDDKKPILTLELAGYGLPTDAIWIYPKVIISVGNDYVITEEGDSLNLREDPSINANILREIRAGEKVTIIGGPESSDGYTWWQIKTEDALLGWVVENEDWYKTAR